MLKTDLSQFEKLKIKKEPEIGDIGIDGTKIVGFLWRDPVTEKQMRLASTVTGGVLPADEQSEVDLAIEREKEEAT